MDHSGRPSHSRTGFCFHTSSIADHTRRYPGHLGTRESEEALGDVDPRKRGSTNFTLGRGCPTFRGAECDELSALAACREGFRSSQTWTRSRSARLAFGLAWSLSCVRLRADYLQSGHRIPYPIRQFFPGVQNGNPDFAAISCDDFSGSLAPSWQCGIRELEPVELDVGYSDTSTGERFNRSFSAVILAADFEKLSRLENPRRIKCQRKNAES